MDMKRFIVDVDFTVSQRIQVDALTEEQAKEIINRLIEERPYDYVREVYVKHEITDVVED